MTVPGYSIGWVFGMHKRINLFGIEIDVATMTQAVERIYGWLDQPRERCRYVVTPNVDHVVKLQHHSHFQRAYCDADLVLADGHPVVLASRLMNQPLPERVPGSELAPALFAAATPFRPVTTFLLGAAEGVAERAAENIHHRWPDTKVVGCYSPPLGFERDSEECDRILEKIAECQPEILVVGLGAPKQELWVHAHRDQLQAKVALCIGATIDFLAGEKKRAPVWVQKIGMEWAHRVASEPGRLFGRYASDAWVFPQLMAREYFGSKPG